MNQVATTSSATKEAPFEREQGNSGSRAFALLAKPLLHSLATDLFAEAVVPSTPIFKAIVTLHRNSPLERAEYAQYVSTLASRPDTLQRATEVVGTEIKGDLPRFERLIKGLIYDAKLKESMAKTADLLSVSPSADRTSVPASVDSVVYLLGTSCDCSSRTHSSNGGLTGYLQEVLPAFLKSRLPALPRLE